MYEVFIVYSMLKVLFGIAMLACCAGASEDVYNPSEYNDMYAIQLAPEQKMITYKEGVNDFIYKDGSKWMHEKLTDPRIVDLINDPENQGLQDEILNDLARLTIYEFVKADKFNDILTEAMNTEKSVKAWQAMIEKADLAESKDLLYTLAKEEGGKAFELVNHVYEKLNLDKPEVK